MYEFNYKQNLHINGTYHETIDIQFNEPILTKEQISDFFKRIENDSITYNSYKVLFLENKVRLYPNNQHCYFDAEVNLTKYLDFILTNTFGINMGTTLFMSMDDFFILMYILIKC